MKRPLPTSSLTAISLILSSSPAHGQETAFARGKKDKERCEGLTGRARQYDRDDSGGLDRAEFTAYWFGLDGTGGQSAQDNSGDDGSSSTTNAIIPLLPPKASDAYSVLLCQCHDTFGHDESCCDDTATGDDDNEADIDNGDTGNEIWTEVSLVGFEKDKPKGEEKWYVETFCWYVDKAMKDEGVEFDPTATTVVWADIPTTTTEPPPVVTTLASEAPPTTTAAAEEDSPTSTAYVEPVEQTVPAVNTTPDPDDPDVILSEDANAIETDTTAPPATTAAATTVAVTAAATTAAATTAAATTESITTTVPEGLDPITLTFLGSTNGRADAASVEIDDVTHAFWMVALDVMGELFPRRGLSVSGSNAEGGLGMEARQLEWDFGEEASVYFESVTTDMKDVDCPSGLVYVAEDSPCLQFEYTLIPNPSGPLTPGTVEEFVDKFEDEVNDNGALYDALVGEYPDTPIIGMGSPGKGAPFEPNANEVVILTSNTSQTQSVQASGFPVGGIIGIALAASLLALAVVALAVRRVRNKRKRRRELNDSNESNLSEDLEANEVNEDAANVEVWLDEEQEEGGGGAGAASSLAAMGVASTVATRLTTGDTEVIMTEKQPWTKNEPVI